jgi:hypothetical protein
MPAANGRCEFTETESKILAVLSDGMRHRYHELQVCLPDDLASGTALAMHISRIRPKLRRKGHDVICEISGYVRYYRHVRLLVRPDRE